MERLTFSPERAAQLHRRCADWVPVPAPKPTESATEAAVALLDAAADGDPHLATFAAEAMVEELQSQPLLKLLHQAAERADDDELRLDLYRRGLQAVGRRPDLTPVDLGRELLSAPRCEQVPWDAAAVGAVLLAPVSSPSAAMARAAASTRMERDRPRLEIYRLALSREAARGRAELAGLAQEMVNTAYPNRLHALWVAEAVASVLALDSESQAALELARSAAGQEHGLGRLAVFQSLLEELAQPGAPELPRLASRMVGALPADCDPEDAAATCARLLRALDPQLAPVAETFSQARTVDQVVALATSALEQARGRAEQEVWHLAEGLARTGPRIRREAHQVWVGGVPLPVRWDG